MTDAELVAHLDQRVQEYKGNAEILESAIGALFIARTMGWKVVLLMHRTSTVRRYEEILKLSFRDSALPETDYSTKSVAYLALRRVKNFWKAVKGEVPGVRSTDFKASK